MEAANDSITGRPTGWAGIAFGVLRVVGLLMLGGAAPDHADDKPFKDNPAKLTALWRAYYNDSGHRTTIVIAVFLIIAAALAFVVFGNDLRERLASYGAPTTGGLAFAGAIIFAPPTPLGAHAAG